MNKVKAGLKTSEFWLSLAGAIIPVVNTQLGLNIPSDAVLGILGIVATYVLGRSYAKANQ